MKLLIEKLPDLQSLYVSELRLLLSAEQQLHVGLSRLIEKSADSRLSAALEAAVPATEVRVKRIEGILRHAAQESSAITSKPIREMFAEIEDLIAAANDTSVRDAGLAASLHKIQNFDLASYGAVRRFASALGLEGDGQILAEAIHQLSESNDIFSGLSEKITLTSR